MSATTVAVVTGANRGIGLAICQAIARQVSKPLVLYALSRSGADLNIESTSSVTTLKYEKLSLTDKTSISSLVNLIKRDHGGCDVLINNAAVYYYDENITATQRKETLDVNYRGTLAMCQAFLPIMRKNGRMVNVSSAGSTLSKYSPDLQERFRNPHKSLQDIETLVQEYEQAAMQSKHRDNGWPSMTYHVSKAAENAITMILARENPKILINCCCPGWVDTELGAQAGKPPKTVEEGAIIPVRLGFDDIGGVSGQYWANHSTYGKGNGNVAVW